jgi:hypothetical protein
MREHTVFPLVPTATRRRRRPPRAGGTRSADVLPVWLRRRRVEVLLWAFREGRVVDATALTAVLGAKHARDEEPFQQWTRHTVRELLWCEVADWCAERGVGSPPAGTAATVWTLLDHLVATDGFDPGSDPLSLLREPLVDSGGLDARTGRPRRAAPRRRTHPSMRGGSAT